MHCALESSGLKVGDVRHPLVDIPKAWAVNDIPCITQVLSVPLS